MSARPASAARTRAWLVATLLVGGVYLGFYLNRMWYPHDEGALGQTAERVLAGEVPHRDFDEPYTGLLTYVHAAAFATFGIRLPVLRIPLFIMTMLWLVAVFRIALRSTGPPGAAAVALVALAWSVPNYPASMPSWYNLFFATFGAAALLRWEETRLPRWLVLAGIAGGISFLFKLSGLFFIAGGGPSFCSTPRGRTSHDSPFPAPGRRPHAPPPSRWRLHALIFLLWRSIAPFYWFRVVYHFVLPGGPDRAGARRPGNGCPVPSTCLPVARSSAPRSPFRGGRRDSAAGVRGGIRAGRRAARAVPRRVRGSVPPARLCEHAAAGAILGAGRRAHLAPACCAPENGPVAEQVESGGAGVGGAVRGPALVRLGQRFFLTASSGNRFAA